MVDRLHQQNSRLHTWIISGRFFCWVFAIFQINFRRSALRIWTTHMWSNFQVAVSHCSAESENMSLDVVLTMEGIYQHCHWWWMERAEEEGGEGSCVPRLSHSFLLRETSRAQAASVIHHFIHLVTMSSDMVENAPSNIPESSFPARLYNFEDNEAVIRIIIKGRCRTVRHVSRTHRVVLDLLYEQINLESSLSIQHVRITEQMADISTHGAVTTIQWMSLMRLFDMHPLSNLNVDCSLSESYCSAVSQQPPHATSIAYSSPVRLRKCALETKLGSFLVRSTLHLGTKLVLSLSFK